MGAIDVPVTVMHVLMRIWREGWTDCIKNRRGGAKYAFG